MNDTLFLAANSGSQQEMPPQHYQNSLIDLAIRLLQKVCVAVDALLRRKHRPRVPLDHELASLISSAASLADKVGALIDQQEQEAEGSYSNTAKEASKLNGSIANALSSGDDFDKTMSIIVPGMQLNPCPATRKWPIPDDAGSFRDPMPYTDPSPVLTAQQYQVAITKCPPLGCLRSRDYTLVGPKRVLQRKPLLCGLPGGRVFSNFRDEPVGLSLLPGPAMTEASEPEYQFDRARKVYYPTAQEPADVMQRGKRGRDQAFERSEKAREERLKPTDCGSSGEFFRGLSDL